MTTASTPTEATHADQGQIAARSHTATCACHLCLGTVVAQRIEQEIREIRP